MTSGLDPTEKYDGSIRVRLLDDESGTEELSCNSYEAAIDVVKKNQYRVTAAKIVDRDGNVVFTSAEMDIDDWESVWRREKRRQSVDVDEYDCPYDSVSCFAEDLCVQCQIDKVQSQY
ncbi:hypothetical protein CHINAEXTREME_11525 [Halobiforma lacisalsi AJ5]|uniref:Uncharacterized protein n=1 Tax=Natronobacterium lacisalsi AJ5 TaxID=358396 RepID=M0L4H3_NATLA|nr:hypothetical protein [Halobiforma lacisalsi]APW98377.1 hypothetical protein CHINAEXTREME_11525 [Halobiforma lacisalsi AJ5]EMA27983.1 hypothetical protein C445_20077 [Halobiforma lacisalsi AJ5]